MSTGETQFRPIRSNLIHRRLHQILCGARVAASRAQSSRRAVRIEAGRSAGVENASCDQTRERITVISPSKKASIAAELEQRS